MGAVGPFIELLKLNETAMTSRCAVTAFWEKYCGVNKSLDCAFEALIAPLPENLAIDLVPHAQSVLSELQAVCDLALVTHGNPNLQLQKMEKAGIQPNQFSKLVIGSGPSKKFDYQTVINDLGQNPEDVIVCGDRVSLDLSPGKELGFFTVHFVNGRGLLHQEPAQDVDLKIKELNEITKVLKKHEN